MTDTSSEDARLVRDLQTKLTRERRRLDTTQRILDETARQEPTLDNLKRGLAHAREAIAKRDG